MPVVKKTSGCDGGLESKERENGRGCSCIKKRGKHLVLDANECGEEKVLLVAAERKSE